METMSVIFIIIGVYYACIEYEQRKKGKNEISDLLNRKNIADAQTMFNLVMPIMTNYKEADKVKKNDFLSKCKMDLPIWFNIAFLPAGCVLTGWFLSYLLMFILSLIIGYDDVADFINTSESLVIFCAIISCIYLIIIREKIRKRFRDSLKIYTYYCEKL
jgi:hypothetical protein